MFTKKVPKSQSASKLLKILTKRSSLKRIQKDKGIYDQWPTHKKPSLFNYPQNYLKYVNNQQKQEEIYEKRERIMRKQKGLRKIPASFSTCTTVEFFSPNQQKIRILSRFTSTPLSQQLDPESNYHNNNLTQNIFVQGKQFEVQNQRIEKMGSFNEESFQEMNCKYLIQRQQYEKKNNRPLKRLVKTAKIDRQQMAAQSSYYTQKVIQSRKSSHVASNQSFSRPKTANNAIQIKQKNNQFNLKLSKFNSNQISQNEQKISKYPLRLKDYETNFHAYKVISDLIDQKMKWQPKRVRPKSSAAFKKQNSTLKY